MLTATFTALLLAAPAPTAAPAEARVRFYDFAELLLEGGVVRPQVLLLEAEERAKFEKLVRLRKPLLPKLRATARDASLR
jgi:hypothetical protein